MGQSLAQKSVLNGQQFSRVHRRVSTNGVSVEVDVGASAIFVGPDSDFACYGVYYFDPSTDYKVIQLATINANRPFVGRLAANLTEMPTPLVSRTVSGVKIDPRARLVIVPEDGFDRVGFSASVPEPILGGFLNPRIDLIIANTERIPVVVGRSESKIDFALKLPDFATVPVTGYLVPCYGRRELTISAGWVEGGAAPGPAPTVTVQGIRSTNNDSTLQDALLTGVAIGGLVDTLLHYVADDPAGTGAYDYLIIFVFTAAGFAGSNPEDHDSGGFRMQIALKD